MSWLIMDWLLRMALDWLVLWLVWGLVDWGGVVLSLENQGLQVLLVWLDVSKWHGMSWVWLLWLSVVGVVHGMDWHGCLVWLGVAGVVPCMWLVWHLGGS